MNGCGVRTQDDGQSGAPWHATRSRKAQAQLRKRMGENPTQHTTPLPANTSYEPRLTDSRVSMAIFKEMATQPADLAKQPRNSSGATRCVTHNMQQPLTSHVDIYIVGESISCEKCKKKNRQIFLSLQSSHDIGVDNSVARAASQYMTRHLAHTFAR